MRKLANFLLVVAAISLVVGIISRLTLKPINIAGGLEAEALLSFTNTCLLGVIALALLQGK